MKTKMFYVLALLLMFTPRLLAQTQTVTVEANSEDISNNLDLKAVASVFGQSKNLEEFEQRLNDYDNQLSNLDLNGDGEVDYLRVIEIRKNKVHLIVIQAVLGEDIFQDVATILVEKDEVSKKTIVQVVGDSYIYGPNYIVEPVYIYVPVIFDYFWGPRYVRWYSPYYWGYYPSYYRSRPYVHVDIYIAHIHHYHSHHHGSYRYPSRPYHYHRDMYDEVSRRDYATRHPQGSYEERNASRTGTYGNARDLNMNRPARHGSMNNAIERGTGLEGGRVSTDGRTQGRTGNVGDRTVERVDKNTRISGSRNNTNTGTKTTVRVTPTDSRTTRETGTRVESSGRTTTTRVERDKGTRVNNEVRTSSSSSSSRSGSGVRSSNSTRTSKESSVSTSRSSNSSSVRQSGSTSKSTGTRSTGSSSNSGSRSGQERTTRR